MTRPARILFGALSIILIVQYIYVDYLHTKKIESGIYYEDKALVLMYHHIDEKESEATITAEKFATHMSILHEQGYNVISIEQLAEFMQNGADIPNNAVVITFDDGYDSFRQYAVPIMDQYDMTATHFIIGKSSDNETKGLPHLSWDSMRELKEQGYSFYSHTYASHHYKEVTSVGNLKRPMLKHRIYLEEENRRETKSEYLDRVSNDLATMEQRLKEELNNDYQILSYPFGAYNRQTNRIAKELGVQLFVTTEEGSTHANGNLVYRLNAGTPSMDAEHFAKLLEHYW